MIIVITLTGHSLGGGLAVFQHGEALNVVRARYPKFLAVMPPGWADRSGQPRWRRRATKHAASPATISAYASGSGTALSTIRRELGVPESSATR